MAAKIYETNDYRKFEIHLFNRDVEKTTALEKSMKKYGFIDAYPLHVEKNGSGKFVIKAGHHRFTAAQKLGLPVKYVVSNEGAGIHELEAATRPWEMNDYLTSFVRCGNRHYIEVKAFHDITRIPLACCISMLAGHAAGSNNKMPQFKAGTYTTKKHGIAHAEAVADVVSAIKTAGIPWAANSLVVKAISRVVFVKQVDIGQLKAKIFKHKVFLEKQPTVNAYVELLEKIYNWRSREKIPLTFLANEAASSRQKFFGG